MTAEPWRAEAACLTAGVNMFPEQGDVVGECNAKQVCQSCPVIAPCLDFAITNREAHGIWGGRGVRERDRIRRRMPPSALCHRCNCVIARPGPGKRYCNDCAPLARADSVRRYNDSQRTG